MNCVRLRAGTRGQYMTSSNNTYDKSHAFLPLAQCVSFAQSVLNSNTLGCFHVTHSFSGRVNVHSVFGGNPL